MGTKELLSKCWSRCPAYSEENENFYEVHFFVQRKALEFQFPHLWNFRFLSFATLQSRWQIQLVCWSCLRCFDPELTTALMRKCTGRADIEFLASFNSEISVLKVSFMSYSECGKVSVSGILEKVNETPVFYISKLTFYLTTCFCPLSSFHCLSNTLPWFSDNTVTKSIENKQENKQV